MSKKKIDKFRLKIFLWYLITEPLRIIKDFFNKLFIKPVMNTYYWFKKQNNNLIFALIATLSFSFFLGLDKKWLAMISYFILFLIIAAIEYKSGYFMHRWREKEKKRVEKKFRGGKIK